MANFVTNNNVNTESKQKKITDIEYGNKRSAFGV